VLIFTSNYIQNPAFKELFKRLVASPIIKKIDDETGNTKEKDRIYKQDWNPRIRTLFTLASLINCIFGISIIYHEGPACCENSTGR
jgi:hypothetical protein